MFKRVIGRLNAPILGLVRQPWPVGRGTRGRARLPWRGVEALEPRVLLTATLIEPIADVVVMKNEPPVFIDLGDHFDESEIEGTVVQFDTVLGDWFVELFDTAAPLNVANFLNYVNDGDYVDTFVHRIADGASSPRFAIQGGSFNYDGEVGNVDRDDPVVNEPDPVNRPSVRGTLSMAKSSDPDSASSGWFVNTTDNPFLDNPLNSGGFTVLGAVRKGMEVVDAIAGLPFAPFDINLVPAPADPLFETLPVRNYFLDDFNLGVMADEDNLVIQNDIFVVPSVTLLDLEIVSNNNEAVVEVTIEENDLILDFQNDQSGMASVTVRATDPQGNDVEETFTVIVTEEFFDEGFEEGFSDDYTLENDATVVDDGEGTGNQVAQLTESSDAAFARDFDLPPEVGFIDLDYRFTNVGDGDVLVVNILTDAGTVEVFREVGTDFTGGAAFVTTGLIDILQFANEEVTIEVRLDSANAVNAQVQVDDLRLLAADLFTVRIGDDEARRVSFTDPDLTVGTISLKTGIAEVKFEGDDLERIVTKKGVTVTGSARISSIELIGTTAKSTLKVKAKGGADGLIDVGDITADGDMKAISAKVLRLLGDIDIDGALLKLDLNSADSGHEISVGAPVVPNLKAKLAIKINHAVDTSVSSEIGIASIKAKEGWIDSDPEDDDVFTIEAPWMGKASFGGDVLVDLLLAGVGAPKGVALGGVKTKAGILGGLWTVLAGDVGAIRTKTAIAQGWTGRFHEAHVKSIKAGTDASLDLEAASAKAISAKVRIHDSIITLSQPFGEKTKALGKLSAKDLVENVTIRTLDNVGAVSALGLHHTRIYAGYPLAMDDAVRVPAVAATTGASIRKVSLKAKDFPGFLDVILAGATVGKLSLKEVRFDNPEGEHGIVAGFIAGLAGELPDGEKFKLSKLDEQAQFDAEIAAGGLDLEELIVRLF